MVNIRVVTLKKERELTSSHIISEIDTFRELCTDDSEQNRSLRSRESARNGINEKASLIERLTVPSPVL